MIARVSPFGRHDATCATDVVAVRCGGPRARGLQPAGRTLAWMARGVLIGCLVALGGCAQSGSLLTAALGEQRASATDESGPTEPTPQEVQQALTFWAAKFSANPGDETTALTFANNLRHAGKDKQAVAVLTRAAMANPSSRKIAGLHGRLALKLGDVKSARRLLNRAYDPNDPDWRVLSARGVAEAQSGEAGTAVATLMKAREMVPNNTSVANNLALALALRGDAEGAKNVLRGTNVASNDADGKLKVRQNLALLEKIAGGATATSDAWQVETQPAAQ